MGFPFNGCRTFYPCPFLRGLLADAHECKDSRKPEEQGGSPCGEKGRENPCFSNGEKDVESDPIGKANHHTDADAEGDAPGSACLQGEWNTDEDHDQVEKGEGEFRVERHEITGGVITGSLDLLDVGLELGIAHFIGVPDGFLEGFPFFFQGELHLLERGNLERGILSEGPQGALIKNTVPVDPSNLTGVDTPGASELIIEFIKREAL